MDARSLGAAALLAVPLAVGAQSQTPEQTADDLAWPENGQFPAYPKEPDERPWRFFVSGSAIYDSNLFRLSDGVDTQALLGTGKRSDWVYRLGTGFKMDLPASRQRFIVDARVDDYNFDRFGFLDYVGYRGNAMWKWQAGNDWSGDVGYLQRRYLAALSVIQLPIQDLITQRVAYGSANYLLTPRWRMRGAADWTQYEHSNALRSVLDADITSVTVGADYLTPSNNSVGGQFKYTHGDYTNREIVATSIVDNNYDQYEASAVLHWILTGISTIDARLGYTVRNHEQLSQRDFDGVTGRLAWDWTPAAKTLITLAAWREIQPYEDVFANYVLSQGVSLTPRWSPTVKLVFEARLLYENRQFQGNPGFILGVTPEREDDFRAASVSAGYTPVRNLYLGISAETGKRTSNIDLRDFDYNLYWLSAKFAF
jgi:exopolysaccharide biosynthesis operon protein EpsL